MQPPLFKFFCPDLKRFIAATDYNLAYYFTEHRTDAGAGEMRAFFQDIGTRPDKGSDKVFNPTTHKIRYKPRKIEVVAKHVCVPIAYSGLRDAVGQPIFHGDLLTHPDPSARYPVMVFFHKLGVVVYPLNSPGCRFNDVTPEYKITGSAWLNPEVIPWEDIREQFIFNPATL
jgi:hypothetical protein